MNVQMREPMPEVSKNEEMAAIRNMFAEARAESHPLFRRLLAGELDQSAIELIAYDIHAVVRAFPRFLAALLARIEDYRFRMDLAENLFCEHGRGNAAEVHEVTYHEFLNRIGADVEASRRHSAHVAVDAYIHAVMGACQNSCLPMALGMMGAIEETVARVSPLIGRFAAERADAQSDDEHFGVHAELDLSHADEIYEVGFALSDTDGARQRFLRGVEYGIFVQTRLYSDLLAARAPF